MGTTAQGVRGQTPAPDTTDESMSPMLHSKVRVGLPIVSRKPTSPVKGKGTGSRSAARIKERFHVCDCPVPIPPRRWGDTQSTRGTGRGKTGQRCLARNKTHVSGDREKKKVDGLQVSKIRRWQYGTHHMCHVYRTDSEEMVHQQMSRSHQRVKHNRIS